MSAGGLRPGGMAAEEAGLKARLAALQEEEAALEAEEAALEAELEAAAKAAEAARRRVCALEWTAARNWTEAERNRVEVVVAKRRLALHQGLEAAKKDPAFRDWGNHLGQGLPEGLLEMVAGKVAAQAKQAEQKHLFFLYDEEVMEQKRLQKRVWPMGHGLFVFAMVCKEWRKAQLKVGGPLFTRVHSDVILPGGWNW